LFYIIPRLIFGSTDGVLGAGLAIAIIAASASLKNYPGFTMQNALSLRELTTVIPCAAILVCYLVHKTLSPPHYL